MRPCKLLWSCFEPVYWGWKMTWSKFRMRARIRAHSGIDIPMYWFWKICSFFRQNSSMSSKRFWLSEWINFWKFVLVKCDILKWFETHFNRLRYFQRWHVWNLGCALGYARTPDAIDPRRWVSENSVFSAYFIYWSWRCVVWQLWIRFIFFENFFG